MTSRNRVALIVHAHPETESFSSAQASQAAHTLRSSGYVVDTIDLYADQWQPVIRAEEFPGTTRPFKPQAEQMKAVADGTLEPAVRDHLDRLLAADLVRSACQPTYSSELGVGGRDALGPQRHLAGRADDHDLGSGVRVAVPGLDAADAVIADLEACAEHVRCGRGVLLVGVLQQVRRAPECRGAVDDTDAADAFEEVVERAIR